MVYFKIIETSSQYPDVLIHRKRDRSEAVEIKAVGIIDGTGGMFAIEKIIFESQFLALKYIEDFTKKSADEWCRKEEITYS